MKTILVNNKLDFKNYLFFAFKQIYRNPIFMSTLIIGVILLVIAILGLIGIDLINMTFIKFSSVLGFFFLILLPLMLFNKLRTEYKTKPELSEESRFELSNKGFKISSLSFQDSFNWTDIYRLKESKKSFKIFTKKNQAHILLKSNFTEADKEFFTKIVSTQSKNKA